MADRIRVLLLTGSLGLGGTERNILHIATSLDKERFDVEVWSDYDGEPVQEQLVAAGILCQSLKGQSSLGKFFLWRIFFHNLPYQWKLFRLLMGARKDVIHAFGFPMAYYAILLGRLAFCKRMIFAVQDWDVWKKSWRYRFLDKLISRFAWRVICDGEGARKLAIEQQGMKADKLITIYDGVNEGELNPSRPIAEIRAELGLVMDAPVIGVIARLDLAKKGQDDFLKALPSINDAYPDAQFLVVGDGPDRAKVEELVADLPESARPVLAGFREDLADMLAAVDVLVIPSRWESVPKILLEGMWLWRVVVATRVGDIEEILDDETGVLIPSDDPQALADAVKGLLADPEWCVALAERAHEKLEERGLTLAASVKHYEKLYAG
jgi:glycosyltransferase involved in cell wall biosynthesis